MWTQTGYDTRYENQQWRSLIKYAGYIYGDCGRGDMHPPYTTMSVKLQAFQLGRKACSKIERKGSHLVIFIMTNAGAKRQTVMYICIYLLLFKDHLMIPVRCFLSLSVCVSVFLSVPLMPFHSNSIQSIPLH